MIALLCSAAHNRLFLVAAASASKDLCMAFNCREISLLMGQLSMPSLAERTLGGVGWSREAADHCIRVVSALAAQRVCQRG
jgi:hypothetical protein